MMKNPFGLYRWFLEKMKERLTGLRFEPNVALDMATNFTWWVTEQI